MSTSLRIAVIGSSRFPIAQPFAGGLEAHIWHLAHRMARRGHQVTLFASHGSDAPGIVEVISVPMSAADTDGRVDTANPPEWVAREHRSYHSLMRALAGRRAADFDVIHNQSLHHLPVALASTVDVPMVTTLHTPPIEAIAQAAATTHSSFVAVSAHTARTWRDVTDRIEVIHNGVDLRRWPVGPGGGGAIFSGRLVAEKGADRAITAARAAGMRLAIAGPIIDRPWFDRHIAPELDGDITYLGHLDQGRLADAVGRASVALVTPVWDEPYGLVVAEALASGTPVAGFARGGMTEIVDDTCAVLVAPDDAAALAAAIPRAAALSRADCRRRAEAHCSLEVMAGRYETLFRRLAALKHR